MSFIIEPSSLTQILPLNDLFPRKAPLEIDLGCGNGRFLTAKAQCNPLVNFLGVDRSKKRVLKTDKKIRNAELTNVRLIKAEVECIIKYLLPVSSVSTFYIFFPDPWPKRRHHKRRLINTEFLNYIYECMTIDGMIHFATDHEDYFEVIKKLCEQDPRFGNIPPMERNEEERTQFELIFLNQNKEIMQCSFRKHAG